MKTITQALFIALLSTAAYAQQADQPSETSKPKTGDTSKAEGKTTEKGAQKEKLTANELQVMAHYHELNNLEIDLGKYAQKNAGSQAVKSYGEMLVKDHGENNRKLRDLAKQTGQAIPSEKPATDAEKQEHAEAKKHAAELKKLKRADFDREYLRMMVADHDKELAMIDTKIGEVQNSQLQDLLRETKPVLQKHADQARELQKSTAQAMNQPSASAPQKK